MLNCRKHPMSFPIAQIYHFYSRMSSALSLVHVFSIRSLQQAAFNTFQICKNLLTGSWGFLHLPEKSILSTARSTELLKRSTRRRKEAGTISFHWDFQRWLTGIFITT